MRTIDDVMKNPVVRRDIDRFFLHVHGQGGYRSAGRQTGRDCGHGARPPRGNTHLGARDVHRPARFSFPFVQRIRSRTSRGAEASDGVAFALLFATVTFAYRQLVVFGALVMQTTAVGPPPTEMADA